MSINKQGIVNVDTGTVKYLINNFTETGTTTDWNIPSGASLSNGTLIMSGVNPSLTSVAFPIGADDILCFEFTVSLPTPSTTTSGPGFYFGTQYGQNGNYLTYNYTTQTYSESGNSTNRYFLSSYNSTEEISVKAYIIGSNVPLIAVPPPEKPSTYTGTIYPQRITGGTTTYIRTGYNSNTSMVIHLKNPRLYKINQCGICENSNEARIGKGYVSFSNFYEI